MIWSRSTPITPSVGPVSPRSVMYAVPPGSTRSSAVCTWRCVPTTALARPSRYQPIASDSDVASQCMSTRTIGVSLRSSGRISSAFRNGQSIGSMNTRPIRFMLPIDCPFRKADEILPELRKETPIVLVDMHCEATSESLAMGWYLDGRASAVVGTHRHVQTADERVLPGGTAYITDLGLTGPTDGVIDVDRDQIIQRFLNQMPIRFETAKGPAALQGVVIVVEPETGRASSIRRLRVAA